MKKVRFAQREVWVRRTGMPFYDANRLLGAAYYFFGHATARIEDLGGWWRLQGPVVQRTAEQVSWVADRLKNRGLERIEETTLAALDDLEKNPALQQEIEAYFTRSPQSPEASTKVPRASVGRYLEPSFLRGARGPEAFTYGALASEMGRGYDDALPEVMVGTIGLCFAGIAQHGRDERWLVLPVLATDAGGAPITLGPFYDFDHRMFHSAGGLVASVGLALEMHVRLAGRLPLADFAYARFRGRGFYQTGLLGLRSVLTPFLPTMDSLAADSARFIRRTVGARDEHLLHTARALAAFLHHPNPTRLERVVRLKARGLHREDSQTVGATMALLASAKCREEVLRLVSPHVDVPHLSRLARQVALALAAQGKGWIGWYTRLEGMQHPDRFVQEMERLLARTAFAAAKSSGEDGETKVTTINFPRAFGLAREEVEEFKRVLVGFSPAHFRVFKSVFLLTVLHQFTGYARQQQLQAASDEAATVSEEGEQV